MLLPLAVPRTTAGQSATPPAAPTRPALAIGPLSAALRLDGILDEPAWANAPAIERLTMTEPDEGGTPVAGTVVRVLADADAIVFGVLARHPDPAGIVSTSKARDPELDNQDYVKIVLDPFLDGRGGYVFAVNPGGARYDALVARTAMMGEDPQWDAVWEARTHRDADGWSAEIRIPLRSLSFDASLDRWGFNVERRVERLQEVSRWASPVRDARVSQTSRAGLLTDVPRFDTGLGLTIRGAVVPAVEKIGAGRSWASDVEPSLDVFQRLGSNLTAMATVNTDFAETEVDTRRTNLTRFPLFFPEKRTFFLEGSDLFGFGMGLTQYRSSDLVPFFSRRIGLREGVSVPLEIGGKITGKVRGTSIAALLTSAGGVAGVADAATLGAVRIRQNVFAESTVGLLGTFGDPAGHGGSYLVGGDFTYQTSQFRGGKTLQAGVWALTTDRQGLAGDRTAFGASVAYPNDIWDVSLTWTRIGGGFEPALGFVPRTGFHKASLSAEYRIYPASLPWLRSMVHEFRPTLYLDLAGRWESYRLFNAPINWQLESGDRLEFNVNPEGERLDAPFEIADGVVIEPGAYHYVRYRLEAQLAEKRPISGQLAWGFGSGYDGSRDLYEGTLRI
ncbi:MAG: carbohydrate binding family 9 domain-containing protein [Gemmatimonadetes bacterium]|nr:carbohydrate binding family 9 domain-containing protein [Gemmatimonadota bacterium]